MSAQSGQHSNSGLVLRRREPKRSTGQEVGQGGEETMECWSLLGSSAVKGASDYAQLDARGKKLRRGKRRVEEGSESVNVAQRRLGTMERSQRLQTNDATSPS